MAGIYGMWRPAGWLLCGFLLSSAHASVFSEAGAGGRQAAEKARYADYEADLDYARQLEQLQAQEQYEKELEALIEERAAEEAEREQAAYEQQMADIVEQLQKDREQRDAEELEIELQREQQQQPQEQEEQEEIPVEEEKEKEQPAAEEQEPKQEEAAPEVEEQHAPITAQKKGQSEFVSFVEPVAAARTQDLQQLEKRRMSEDSVGRTMAKGYSGTLMMLAVGTVLVVGTIGTVIGGSVYYRRRSECPDDSEYAPYAGTGPGMKKKKGDKGDDSLAYKAQLHHYQQAKQKIICGDDAPGVGIESDDEGADDENNFSVYECPGLAPTGDIEVCNPNFGH